MYTEWLLTWRAQAHFAVSINCSRWISGSLIWKNIFFLFLESAFWILRFVSIKQRSTFCPLNLTRTTRTPNKQIRHTRNTVFHNYVTLLVDRWIDAYFAYLRIDVDHLWLRDCSTLTKNLFQPYLVEISSWVPNRSLPDCRKWQVPR